MPSQGGALQAIGLNLPQIFVNRTHSLASKLLPSVVLSGLSLHGRIHGVSSSEVRRSATRATEHRVKAQALCFLSCPKMARIN